MNMNCFMNQIGAWRKLLVLSSIACLVASVTPLKSQAVSEINYQKHYQKDVVPFFNSIGKISSIKGENDWPLPYIAFVHKQPRANIAIAGGYNESFRKYDEAAYDLYQQGYSVYILDYRGQGSAPHFLQNPRKGYVDLFINFTRDFKRFVDLVVPMDPMTPRFLISHSLGGAIAAHYLEKYPEDFAAAALSSPMLSINLGREEWIANAELYGLSWLGKDKQLAPGTSMYSPAISSFDTNIVTHSRERFAKNTSILVAHPEVFVGGQTVHWLIEGIRGSRFARNHGQRTQTKVLLLQAGADEMVLPDGQNLFCKQAQFCTLSVISQSKHEILQEKDEIRDPAFVQILNFFHAREKELEILN